MNEVKRSLRLARAYAHRANVELDCHRIGSTVYYTETELSRHYFIKSMAALALVQWDVGLAAADRRSIE